jgi:hypothetical protein
MHDDHDWQAADRIGAPAGARRLPLLVGLGAVVFSVFYIVSDVIELAQGGFSTTQLVLTYAAEAALPLFVIGLYAVQRPAIGRLGLVGALGPGCSPLDRIRPGGGVVLVAATTALPDLIRTLAAAVRAGAFIGMGVSVLRLRNPGDSAG